jgi:hypothetical protein
VSNTVTAGASLGATAVQPASLTAYGPLAGTNTWAALQTFSGGIGIGKTIGLSSTTAPAGYFAGMYRVSNDTYISSFSRVRIVSDNGMSLGSEKIEDLANGTLSTDAVNKGQLDLKVDLTTFSNSNLVWQGHYNLLSTQKVNVADMGNLGYLDTIPLSLVTNAGTMAAAATGDYVPSTRTVTVGGVTQSLASNVTFTVSETDTLQAVVNRGATITNAIASTAAVPITWGGTNTFLARTGTISGTNSLFWTVAGTNYHLRIQ